MKLFNGVLVCVLLILLSAAQPPEKKVAQNYAARIIKQSQSIQTLSARFTQKKYLSVLQDSVETTGTLLMKKPNKIKWNYRKPFLYTIIIDGKTVTIKDGTHQERFRMDDNPAFRMINRIVAGSLDGSLLKDNSLFSFSFSEEKQSVRLDLKPTRKTMPFTGISLWFDKKTLIIKRVLLHENGKDYTDIVFHQAVLNKAVDDALFQ